MSTTVQTDPQRACGPLVACCVALRVQETADQSVGDVEILSDLPRVTIGDPHVLLLGLIAYRFAGELRETLLDRVDELGALAPSQPVRIEGLREWPGGTCVCIEALIVPLAREQRDDLEQLLSDSEDPHIRQELAWLYAEDLVAAHGTPRPVPVRFLTLPPRPFSPDVVTAPPLDAERIAALV